MKIDENTIKASQVKSDDFIKAQIEWSKNILENTFKNIPAIELVDVKKSENRAEVYVPPLESIKGIMSICELYCNYVFIGNETILSYFKKYFGLKEEHLRWFISYDEIIYEINKINKSKNFNLLPFETIMLIYEYLEQKIELTISNAFVENPDNLKTQKSFAQYEHDKYVRKTKNRKNKVVNELKQTQSEVYQELYKIAEKQIESLNLTKSPSELIRDISKGNVEYLYLPKLFNECLIAKNINYSKNEKCRTIFDLFKLILKDEDCWSEERFSDFLENHKYKNYNRYKEAFVKNILSRK